MGKIHFPGYFCHRADGWGMDMNEKIIPYVKQILNLYKMKNKMKNKITIIVDFLFIMSIMEYV